MFLEAREFAVSFSSGGSDQTDSRYGDTFNNFTDVNPLSDLHIAKTEVIRSTGLTYSMRTADYKTKIQNSFLLELLQTVRRWQKKKGKEK